MDGHATASECPFAAERQAWSLVAGKPPGSNDFDPAAWDAWLEAAQQASGPDSLARSGWGDLS
jgi:hypothetical protein